MEDNKINTKKHSNSFELKGRKKYSEPRLSVDISCEEAKNVFNSVAKGESPSIDLFLAAHAHIVMCKKCLGEE